MTNERPHLVKQLNYHIDLWIGQEFGSNQFHKILHRICLSMGSLSNFDKHLTAVSIESFFSETVKHPMGWYDAIEVFVCTMFLPIIPSNLIIWRYSLRTEKIRHFKIYKKITVEESKMKRRNANFKVNSCNILHNAL